MSVHAGQILHLGGNNVIDRIQSAGLGDVRIPIETIREVGNREVVDKVTGEPDFTFTMESLDVSTELIAFLQGKVGVSASASASAPGAEDPSGTVYDWLDCEFVNIASPWKDNESGSAGVVEAGHLIPGFYPTRLRYRYGVTDNATQEVELAGGQFYYAKYAPIEEYASGDGSASAFVTAGSAVPHLIGGAEGTVPRSVFGVIVDGVLQTEDVDYSVTGGSASPGTITFTEAPENGARIRYAYYTTAEVAYPQPVHADSVVKPGAVRGRNIKIFLGTGGDRARVGGVQSFEMEATVEYEVEREMGTDQIVGITVSGTDVTGTVTVRSKDPDAFFALLSKVTGVSVAEVFGYMNQYGIPLEVQIENPKNTGEILKTLYVEDAQFQPPGTPARVNTPTDFAFNFDSLNGTFKEVKGELE